MITVTSAVLSGWMSQCVRLRGVPYRWHRPLQRLECRDLLQLDSEVSENPSNLNKSRPRVEFSA